MGFTPEQIKGRIKSVAKQNNADARTLMRIYMMERFLERLAQSEYRDNFIIKGGILVTAMIGVAHRSTMDIDTSMKNLNLSAEDALRVVNQVKDIDLDDGVSFDVKDVSNIMDEMEYGTPGCTFVFNKALMEKLKQYKPSVISMHDSWISFVCLAVNGFFYSDQNAYIMYRQHDANVLGAQRHSLKDTLMGIVKNKNVLRSDMAKEILKGYSEMMPEKTKEAFIAFAEYKENLKYKLKILMLPYNKKKTTKRTFEKVKLRVVFNTI